MRRPAPGAGRLAPAVIACAVLAGCSGADERSIPASLRAPRPASAAEVLAEPLADSTFAGLVRDLSGPGGYFDTDNLISNEASYLHVLGPLRERGAGGGAYLGVGPGQSFAYVAALRPELAFIVDVRRDNLLQHLLFKALFALSPTRAEYLAHLVGVPPPEDPGAWSRLGAAELVERLEAHPADPVWTATARARVDSAVAASPVPLDADDLATVRRFHDAFLSEGLGLRFRSHGRPPRPYYPTLRRLLTETDLAGREGSLLASEEAYRFVRALQAANRVVPVVGDLAGEHALVAIGDELRRRGLPVTAFYTSNVEFYLWREGTFDRFAADAAALPWAPEGVILRSYFPGGWGRHPHAVPGYHSTQTLQPARDFLAALEEGGFASYADLVTRNAVDPRTQP